jgi:hypothetical protein
MSLVYARKSDEIGCALRVFLHAAMACGTEILMCEGYQESCGYALYESLLTYIPLKDPYCNWVRLMYLRNSFLAL